jgi:hypothetical protein
MSLNCHVGIKQTVLVPFLDDKLALVLPLLRGHRFGTGDTPLRDANCHCGCNEGAQHGPTSSGYSSPERGFVWRQHCDHDLPPRLAYFLTASRTRVAPSDEDAALPATTRNR